MKVAITVRTLPDLLRARGLSVAELARRSKTGENYIHELKAGRRLPSVRKTQALAKALDVNYFILAAILATTYDRAVARKRKPLQRKRGDA